MRIIFLGTPGCGKSTQSKRIADHLSIPYVSISDIIRKSIKNDLKFIQKTIMDEGKLISDEIACRIIQDRITQVDCCNGYILDGFPRTMEQVRYFEKILFDLDQIIDMVIYFDVDLETIIDRLVDRRICSNCGEEFHLKYKPSKQKAACDCCHHLLIRRSDDAINKINYRMALYKKQTTPIIQYYKQKKVLKTITTKDNINNITNTIMQYITISKNYKDD